MENANAASPTAVGWRFPVIITRIMPRAASDSCHPVPDVNLCEKPAMSNTKTFIILIVMTSVFAVAFGILLLFLHRRRRRMDKAEGAKDPQELDDYGMAPDSPSPAKTSHMPAAPPPVQTSNYSQHNNERTQPQGASNRDWRTSGESLTPSFRQATPVVPRDGLSIK